MNILKQITIGASVIFALTPSPALPSDPTPESSATSSFWGQPVSSVNYWTGPDNNQAALKGSTSRNNSFFEGLKNRQLHATKSHATKSRISNLSVGISQTEMFIRNDRTSITLYALTPMANRSLSLVQSASSSQMDNDWVRLVQSLSLANTRQINTEFAYSLPVDKNSKFDTAISYQIGPVNDSGKSGVTASFRYNGKF